MTPPPSTSAELVQLHVRVIALERIVIALLGQIGDAQSGLIRDMAAYIYPRRTRHHLTIAAAAQMIKLIEGAEQFRAKPVRSRRERRPRVRPASDGSRSPR